MNTPLFNTMRITYTLGLLLLLPHCAPIRWIKEKLGVGSGEVEKPGIQQTAALSEQSLDDGSPVLASIQGKAIITEKSLKRDFNDFLAKNPEIKQWIAIIPDAEEKFLKGLIDQKIMDQFVLDHQIDRSPDYQKDLEEFIKAGKQMLNAKHFMQLYRSEPSDAEAKEFYETYRSQIPEALISHGGVRAIGIQFDTKEEAQAFLKNVSATPTEFESVASQAGLGDRVHDFQLVHAQSDGIHPSVRSYIINATTIPGVDIVSSKDNTHWVVAVTGKEDSQYHAFEDIAPAVKQRAAGFKNKAILDQEINKLKQEYKVTVNSDYFKKKQVSDQDVLSALLQSSSTKEEKSEKPHTSSRVA